MINTKLFNVLNNGIMTYKLNNFNIDSINLTLHNNKIYNIINCLTIEEIKTIKMMFDYLSLNKIHTSNLTSNNLDIFNNLDLNDLQTIKLIFNDLNLNDL
jgi:hypothetical protein